VEVRRLGDGASHLIVRYGFMEDPDIPDAVIAATTDGLAIDPDDSAYFPGRKRFLSPSRLAWRDGANGRSWS
jgi:KUP system potassium uptake protein